MNFDLALDFIRVLVPFITLVISIGVGVIAWLMRDKLNNLEKKIDILEADIKRLQREHEKDQREIMKAYVTNDQFHHAPVS